MEGIKKPKQCFGLVGRNISYSFSKGYFAEKFENLGLDDHFYDNYDLSTLSDFAPLRSKGNLRGLNVTIPYKEGILDFLDHLDGAAERIGAVNTIKFTEKGLIGFNTDTYGFKNALLPLLHSHHKKALILGTGGASKAVAYVLEELGISYRYVSRNPKKDQYGYSQLRKEHLEEHHLIINCTPLGTFPRVTDKPLLPYEHLDKNHLLFDLIYNPVETAFLQEGKKKGATIKNGLQMLQLQAEKSWEIWNSPEI